MTMEQLRCPSGTIFEVTSLKLLGRFAFRGFVFLNEELLIMELTMEEPPSHQLKIFAEREPIIPNCIKPKVLCTDVFCVISRPFKAEQFLVGS